MPDLVESNEAFDLALLNLLQGVAGSARHDLVHWEVCFQDEEGRRWEIDVWLADVYLGRYLAQVGEYELLCG